MDIIGEGWKGSFYVKITYKDIRLSPLSSQKLKLNRN